ncbi:MAG: ATP-binding protein [Crocosphaera sp.]|nr:ATP-binding protein [Crocosphaera sp.]
MLLNGKPLDKITESDLQELIDNEVAEGKTIDYKEKLSGNSDTDKKEFLYDVSSFANASGGHLIFGISEDKGIAIKIDGIETKDIDKEILRLDNILRDGVSPRIPGIRIQPIQLQNNSYVIIIDIPRSFALPHMVTYKNSSRFYSRNSRGKYQLSVDEIRTAFTVSQGLIDRIRDFRRERLSMIIADETPVMLEKGAKLVLHLIPLNAFEINYIITTEKINSIYQKKQYLFSPLYNNHRDWKCRYNLDGFFTYDGNNLSNYNTYSQFFRHGVVEATSNRFANDHYNFPIEKNFIYKDYERDIIYCLNNYLQLQQLLNIPTPIIIFLSMVGVSSYIMGYDLPLGPIFRHTIDRDNLILPEVMIEDYNVDLYQVMKPIFDTVWNAAGYPQSLNYDEQGNWLGNK